MADVFKIVLVGPSGAGKTSCSERISVNKFNGNSTSTIGVDYKVKDSEVDGQKIKVQLWDTAGQERFMPTTVQIAQTNCHAFLFVVDATDDIQFRNYKGILSSTGKDAHVAVMLNKIDLLSEE